MREKLATIEKELAMYKRFNPYKDGKIYKVTNTEDGKVYIGSTYQTLLERWQEHKKDYKKGTQKRLFYTYMRKLGRDKFKIALLKPWPCLSRWHLENAEYAEQLKIPENLRLFVPKKRLPYGLSRLQKRCRYRRNYRRRPSRNLNELVQSSEDDLVVKSSIIPKKTLRQSILHNSWFI